MHFPEHSLPELGLHGGTCGIQLSPPCVPSEPPLQHMPPCHMEGLVDGHTPKASPWQKSSLEIHLLKHSLPNFGLHGGICGVQLSPPCVPSAPPLQHKPLSQLCQTDGLAAGQTPNAPSLQKSSLEMHLPKHSFCSPAQGEGESTSTL